MLTLRAAVDHLSGEGCTVRQVDVVATLDAPPPTVARGMATRLVRDRQVSPAAAAPHDTVCLTSAAADNFCGCPGLVLYLQGY